MVLGVSSRSWLAVTAMRRPGREGVRLSARVRAEVGLTSRVRAREAAPDTDPCGRRRELHTSRSLRAHSGAFRAGKRPRGRAAAFSVAIATEKAAASKCVLPNTHGSVDFPRSPSRDASPVTHPRSSRDEPLAPRRAPSRTPHIPRPSRARSQPARAVTETAVLADPPCVPSLGRQLLTARTLSRPSL